MTAEQAHAVDVPDDPWAAFAVLVGRCATGFATELMASGKTETEARNAVIGCLLHMAAGEACRVARSEGREPNRARWLSATGRVFSSVKRTAALAKARGEEPKP